MKNILVVHQSADLYGSDRVLLGLVSLLDRKEFHPIVLIPIDGPLAVELRAVGVEYHVIPIARLSRATLSPLGLLWMTVNLYRSIRAINRVLNGRCVDLVHSNTLAVLSGALWARWHRVPHLWHVHEIILRPIFVRKVYAWLLDWFADSVVCVSHATKQHLLQDNQNLTHKTVVVWNGMARENPVDTVAPLQYRKLLNIRNCELLVVLIGRINRLKGQILLVEAANLLWQQGVRNLRFVFVGSVVPGQEHYLHALQHAIDLSPAKHCFSLQAFTHNVWPVWNACDIAVIPSTEPESFGLVALEAMAAMKPVIAANHGGLSEILIHGETGLLFEPGNISALADAIKLLASDAQLRNRIGESGELRYRTEFTLVRYVENMSRIYDQI